MIMRVHHGANAGHNLGGDPEPGERRRAGDAGHDRGARKPGDDDAPGWLWLSLRLGARAVRAKG